MIRHTLLMGNPLFFRIKSGKNPHTRNTWGFRKDTDTMRAFGQWKAFKEKLELLGARVFVLQPQKEYPSMVYPANAGFLYPKYDSLPLNQKTFYLSNLSEHRRDEALVYHQFFSALNIEIRTVNFTFEGEADFFPCGASYLFCYGDIVPTGFRARLGFPPWRYQFSHRTDARNQGALKQIIGNQSLIPVKLTDTRFYHGDTCLFAFGKKREYLMAYLECMDGPSRNRLKKKFGNRLIPLSKEDADNFVANSFQLDTADGPHLILPDAVSEEMKSKLKDLGFAYTTVDVTEFSSKGGGSIKCLLCDLGPADLPNHS